MSEPKKQVAWGKIGLFFVLCAVSAVVGWYGQPLIHGNKDAATVIVNVFTILAGFLVTIMTLMGEPSLFLGRTWRTSAVRRNNIYKRLVRHKWLFILYLLVLGLIFVSTLIGNKLPDSCLLVWFEHIYLGLAFLAFTLSLLLPQRLMNLQMSRYDEMIEARKKGSNNSETSNPR